MAVIGVRSTISKDMSKAIKPKAHLTAISISVRCGEGFHEKHAAGAPGF